MEGEMNKEMQGLQYIFEVERESTVKQFWAEAFAFVQKDMYPLQEGDIYANLMNVCGMPSWQCIERVYEHWKEHTPIAESERVSEAVYAIDFDLGMCANKNFAEFRKKADAYMSRERCIAFRHWARQRSEELYAFNLRQFDWKFKDSEIELRANLEHAKRTLSTNGVLTQTLANTILNCVKELNLMYGYTGKASSNISDGAKSVIFLNTDNLYA